jgi:hypothetical protein
MIVAIVLIAVGIVALVAVALVLRGRRDDKLTELKRTPGYDLAIPGGELAWDTVGGSVGGAGANRTRVWTVNSSIEDVTAHVDAELSGLGYERVAGPDGDGHIGEYRLGDARVVITWVGLPHRLPGGRFIMSGYDFVVYTTIENGERARVGS